jgi:hypothetical protein
VLSVDVPNVVQLREQMKHKSVHEKEDGCGMLRHGGCAIQGALGGCAQNSTESPRDCVSKHKEQATCSAAQAKSLARPR